MIWESEAELVVQGCVKDDQKNHLDILTEEGGGLISITNMLNFSMFIFCIRLLADSITSILPRLPGNV